MASDGPEFCSGELWNQNLTWLTDSPDFPTCFHKTVLIYLPCAFLWLLSPFEVRSNFVNAKRFIPWTFLNVSKLASCCLLAIISVLELIHFGLLMKNEDANYGIEVVDFVGSGIKLATFLLAIFLLLNGRRAGKLII